jgi:hypothetical protein
LKGLKIFDIYFEDADFSFATIKKLIKQGEDDAEKVLNEKNKDINQVSNS